MAHNLFSNDEINRHVNRVFSREELRRAMVRARVERSKAFTGMLSAVGAGIRNIVSN